MDTAEPPSRWYRLTPGALIAALLATEVFLWMSQHFAWFAFNQHKGLTVLLAVAAVGAVLAVMLVWWLAAALFRLRFQFSLRVLLVLVLAVALPSSWLAVEMKKARAQREAVAEIKKRRGAVTFDWEQVPSTSPATPQPFGTPWLRAIVGEDFFANVVYVGLDDPQFTDADLAKLNGLTALHDLSLERTGVTDVGMVNLKGLTVLRWLVLNRTQVTDAGLMNLKGHTTLHVLWLAGTKVTDAGLVNLKGLSALQELWLTDTRVTEGGVGKLRQTLPSCEICY